MTEDLMRYDLMVEQALQTAVIEVMRRIAQDGLPGEHHLYITFRTSVDGLMLPVSYTHLTLPTIYSV